MTRHTGHAERRPRGRLLATAILASSAIFGFGMATAVSAGASPARPGTPGTVTAAKSLKTNLKAQNAAIPAEAPDGLFPFTTVTGKVYMSEDAIGTNDPSGGPVSVQKNDSAATVQAAYLLAAGTPGYVMQNGDVTLNGTSLSFAPADSVVGNFGVNSVWADVTSIVKPVVDAAAPGNVAFTAAEPNNTGSIDGEILAVIMNDPTLPTDNTVSFLFGALDTTGDNFSIGLASPLNLSDPNLSLTMSIGDSFGYQGPPATGQFSTISVNGTLMTSSAGGNDDSVCKFDVPQDFANCGDGELITVGGIGDSTANPPDPTATDSTCGAPGPPRCDDELYNLLPFVKNGDTSIQVNTTNPSTNDNIFFTGFQLDSAAAVVGEGVVLTPVSGSSPVNSPYTFTAKVQDSNGNPIASQPVTFTVLSGPNAGKTGTATTNASGNATFTYTSAVTGTDTVQVSFTDTNGASHTSNQATVTWTNSQAATSVSTSLSGGGQMGTSISVPSNTAVTDSATLSGTNAATAGGTVTYKVYSDATCQTAVSTGSPEPITTPGLLPASAPVTLTTPGLYYWQAAYSGDANNAASSSTCGAKGEVQTVTQPVDTTPPSCTLTAVIAGPPKVIQITVQDTGSGLNSVAVTTSTNAKTTVPKFTVGTTQPLVVTSTKTNQSLSSEVALKVTDVAGNVTNCDPIFTTLARGDNSVQTFTGLSQSESIVQIQNGTPGLRLLTVTVNGKTFLVTLRNGVSRTLQIRSAMHPGKTNVIRLQGFGAKGSSADISIRD